MRRKQCAFLIAICVGWTNASAQTETFDALPFRAVHRESLAPDLRVSLDAQGNAQLLWQGELLLQVQWLLADEATWETMPANARLTLRHWPYFSLDSAVLWEVQPAATLARAPTGYRLRTAHEIELVERSVHPHSSVGEVGTSKVRASLLRLNGDAGPLDVAIFALGAHSARWDAQAAVWEMPPSPGPWQLVVVAAESDENLWFDIGQVLRAVRTGRPLASWNAPTLCERCRRPIASELFLQTTREDGSLLLRATLPGQELDSQHGLPVYSTLRIGSISLARQLVDATPNGARYRMPAHGPIARAVEQELSESDTLVRLLSQAGQSFEFGGLRVDLAPPASDAEATDTRSEYPKHLSARLLNATPNPFQEQTQIRVLIPGSVSEAFDVDPQQRQRLAPSSAPFGQQPMLRLRVYDVKGKLVRELFAATHPIGELEVSWNGNDDEGRPVAAGAYYVHLSLGQHDLTHRVTLLKP